MDATTITLEPDAYSLLRAAMLPGESASDAIRRAFFLRQTPITGVELRAYLRKDGPGLSEEYLDAVEAASKHDPSPVDPWV